MKDSPVKSHIQNKFANSPVKTQRFFKHRIYKKANKFGEMWVIKSNNIAAETVSAANNVSTVNNISAANSVSAANLVNTDNFVNTANIVSAANSVSTANSVNTGNTVNAAKVRNEPIILTKYSSHKIPSSGDPQSSKLSKIEYVDLNGKPKTTEAWVPIRN